MSITDFSWPGKIIRGHNIGIFFPTDLSHQHWFSNVVSCFRKLDLSIKRFCLGCRNRITESVFVKGIGCFKSKLPHKNGCRCLCGLIWNRTITRVSSFEFPVILFGISKVGITVGHIRRPLGGACLLYTSDAADD